MLRERSLSLMKGFLSLMKGEERFGKAREALISLETEAAVMDDKSFFAGVSMWFSAFTDVPINLSFS